MPRLPANRYRCWALAEVFERADAAEALAHQRHVTAQKAATQRALELGDGTPPACAGDTDCPVPKDLVYWREAGERPSRPCHESTAAAADAAARSEAIPVPGEGDGRSEGFRGPNGELWFDDDFESGNLDRAHRVAFSRELAAVAAARRAVYEQAADHGAAPAAVLQEYRLRMRNDVNTSGNLQWFHFSVRGTRRGETVRFRVENHTKPDSLFAYGLRPLVLSSRLARAGAARPVDASRPPPSAASYGTTAGAGDAGASAPHPAERAVRAGGAADGSAADPPPPPGTGWHHAGVDCCYFQSQEHYWRPRGRSRRRPFFTASFTYTFPFDDDVVFFAYCRPYTYSRLQRLLTDLEADAATKRTVRRRKLCSTLAGNRCEVVTVTAPIHSPTDLLTRKGAFISARVHPGESNASWMMEGLLRFVTSDAPAAVVLRRRVVLRIVPMLNPDGVILGNYRCSLAGQDLNR